MNDFFEDLLGTAMGKDGKEYRCVKCKYPLEKLMVKTLQQEYRKIFYCKRNTCERFGFLTVIAIAK